ncbi:MAG: tRNA pseudouridine(55) synthase TruB [Desulfobacteraceae bacterium]|nr:tRNA pseudouridine(55) synthase TruB [Desulfobacteraceae bacterium]
MDPKTSGILVVDKPAGLSSASVVGRVKRLLQVSKIGHAGTLDPFATGVLVCCLNKATRLAGFLISGNKTYEAILHLGEETDTQDATGRVTKKEEREILFSKQEITTAFDRFTGHINQLPPVYSALKHKGVPLYKLARAGNPVQKPARPVEIMHMNIVEIHMPFIRFDVTCSSGTYIRALCSDIGHELGCGGHLKALRRTECGGFSLDRAVTLEELDTLAAKDQWMDALTPMKDSLKDLPVCLADRELTEKIKNGRVLSRNDLYPEKVRDQKGLIGLVDENNSLIALLTHEENSTTYPYYCVLI